MTTDDRASSTSTVLTPESVTHRQLERTLHEIEVLAAYARSAGKEIPEAVQKGFRKLADAAAKTGTPAGEHLELALAIHSQLSTLAAPATVRTLECTDPTQKWTDWMVRFWVIPLIFGIMVLALLALVLFSPASAHAASGAAGESSAASTTAKTALVPGGLLNNQLQYLVAAVLGAGFYSLFTAYSYIAARTFDPTYNIIYLVRFLLGVVSGTILANFGPSMGLQGFQTTLLGLIGGYSAEAVNQILLRIGETVVAAVKGSGKEDVKAREATVRSEAREQQAKQRQQTGVELADVLKVAVENGAQPAVIARLKTAMDSLNR